MSQYKPLTMMAKEQGHVPARAADIHAEGNMHLIHVYVTMALLTCNHAVEPFPGAEASTEELVRYYFNMSLNYHDICGFLLIVHHIVVSRTTVKRILRRLKARRYGIESPLEEIVLKIIEQHAMGHIDLGYKSMWKHLITQCGIKNRQETVRRALKAIYPRGVELRRRNLLRRRRYISKGPGIISMSMDMTS